ncbi:TetR/AcrR family transcriptional regulator [Nocardioides cynanchi]|uniref:TetR/AcrR family transcriptional regulator n=1 Tax=Nocardioides cynanchi TaxID=2558918 RepID=UPI001785666E|nr:TetR/AcrR family transcriptional regulator [Nocardioides cynanchi]
MNTTRSYTMTARAVAVAETRARIIDACVALHGERPVTEIALDDVAGRAGVSVQTVLRHFGSRAGLEEASFEHAQQAVTDERRTPVGDVGAAVHVIVDHYERRGDQALLMLAQETHQDLMARITEQGKALHRAWVTEVFAPFLAAAEDAEELTDLLVVATDVYTWKLLRRDRRLSRERTESRIRRLVDALLP